MTTIEFDENLTHWATKRAEKTGETVQEYVVRIIRELVDPSPNVGTPVELLTVDEIHRLAYGCYRKDRE